MGTIVAKAKRAGALRGNLVRLYDAVLSLKNRDECAAFMRDLCTTAELKEFGERFQIAKLLANNKSYRDISDTTGASTTTITRVSHWYHHGQGGYRSVLSRLKT
jgi:TrpR-related protein YerC/YecD